MKIKRIFVTLVLLLCVLPLFAVRRTRVDTSGNTTVKIIWNDAYDSGPDNTNRAQKLEQSRAKLGWTHERVSLYACNNGTGLCIKLYTDDNAGFYDYKYCIKVQIWVDGLWEDSEVTNYYDFQYNQALVNFKNWENLGELSVR